MEPGDGTKMMDVFYCPSCNWIVPVGTHKTCKAHDGSPAACLADAAARAEFARLRKALHEHGGCTRTACRRCTTCSAFRPAVCFAPGRSTCCMTVGRPIQWTRHVEVELSDGGTEGGGTTKRPSELDARTGGSGSPSPPAQAPGSRTSCSGATTAAAAAANNAAGGAAGHASAAAITAAIALPIASPIVPVQLGALSCFLWDDRVYVGLDNGRMYVALDQFAMAAGAEQQPPLRPAPPLPILPLSHASGRMC